MAITFDELGITFPLFEGPVQDAVDYCGRGTCDVCGTPGRYGFLLDVGAFVMASCPKCGAQAGLDASEREDKPCPSCGSLIPFPQTEDEDFGACFQCLREGKVTLTKDTELGMISWEQAMEGVTHGLPGLDRDDFEMVPVEEGWTAARLPKEMMWELLSTPTYLTIQGERWQFCCRRPMIFVGQWSREDFSRHAPDGDGERLFNEIVQDVIPGLWEDELHDVTGVYVFRCPECGARRAHWDLA